MRAGVLMHRFGVLGSGVVAKVLAKGLKQHGYKVGIGSRDPTGRRNLPGQVPASTIDSDPQRATERPGGIVRFRAVVIDEDGVVAAIAEEGTAEFSDSRRGSHPARRFRVEISKFLQFPILFFRQKLNAHSSRHIYSVTSGLMFFP